ncbi:hypothetical protein [Bradyrhizobium elkanii]|uniref:hypothetical protein n=1 Tax=Bradyrhizobium elkanii TaxID=29448 RepID=UPI0020A21E9C|nr:hypothetical protein [Bradyrhizobium elkanii]MCP1974713.1 hypothetical protein [Bradyrhizobium elkanii]MCS3521792.1 hypothetical protein [Bradyrhizobium elkanii]MCS4069447.1 hypothetical protein [Bradyrhizobium elkanii]MCS4076077.1 hypothetical protein [Bradyrhizobium elkanii]MCS4103782.1 hypothetical protein [Bradyrhizobium elkanii]
MAKWNFLCAMTNEVKSSIALREERWIASSRRHDGVANDYDSPLTAAANDSGIISSITRTSHESSA